MVFFTSNSWPQGTLCLASGNSAGISGISGDSGDSGDSGEMGEASAPRTLPSTRAWGQDDGSSHKLPQMIFTPKSPAGIKIREGGALRYWALGRGPSSTQARARVDLDAKATGLDAKKTNIEPLLAEVGFAERNQFSAILHFRKKLLFGRFWASL